jgi:hypothetical protein
LLPPCLADAGQDPSRRAEIAELIIDLGELRPHVGCLALQQANGLFREDVRVNVDRLRCLGGHGFCCL